jgi:cyclomaltodextrinase
VYDRETVRRVFFAAAAAIGLATLAAIAAACSILAGYEDLHLAPAPSGMSDAAGAGDAGPLSPLDLGTASIYSVYPSIFSAGGNLAGVTAALPRIRALGFNVLSLMPITPIGRPTSAHPATIGSPYCVQDYYAINPSYGSPLDLVTLVRTAHALGLYVLLDEELNHTSWDNALISQHPEYYVHSDKNPANVSSIEAPPNFPDVAQLDYGASGVTAYMTRMLAYWLTTYGIDGFRFVTSNLPPADPTIPVSFWQALGPTLLAINPGVVIWGDEENAALAGAPFQIDDGWLLRGGQPGATGGAGLEQVANGASATELELAWQQQTVGYANVRHAAFLETWDFDDDRKVYGGLAATMAAAAFDFTIDGIPVLWNGEEVGNDNAAADTTTSPIDWTGPDATALTAFYTSLLRLRNGHPALQTGAVAWVPTSAPDQVASFTRSDSSGTLLVVISFSGSAVTGTLTLPAPAQGWTDVSPAGSPGGVAHSPPPAFSLAPHDFAVFVAN